MLLIYSARRRDNALSAFDQAARNDRLVAEAGRDDHRSSCHGFVGLPFGRCSVTFSRSGSVARLAARIAVGSQDGSYVGKSEENQIWGWQSLPDPCRAGFCESRFAIRR